MSISFQGLKKELGINIIFSLFSIVCAVSAPSEGTAFIVQKNDSNVYCHLDRSRKEDVSTAPNYPFHMAVGFNSSGSDEDKVTNRTGSSFFNEFSHNQYKSNKNSSFSAIENVPSGETEKYRTSDFRRRKKRNFQSTRKRSKEIEPKTLRPPVDDRTVLCNAQKICCDNMPLNKKKDKKKKKKCTEKKGPTFYMNTFNLNCDEKKLFFRLKSKSCRNKLKCKKCKSCKRYLDRLKLDDDLDLDKRIEKLVRNVALENRRKGNSEEVTQPNKVQESLKEKPQNRVESVSFFEHIRKAFSNSRDYFRSKLTSDSVENIQRKESDSDKAARIRCYDILKTMRKVSRIRRNVSPRFKQPIYRHHRKRHFLHLRRRRFPEMRTEANRVRKIKFRPFHMLGFFSRHGKLQKEKAVTDVTVSEATTESVTAAEMNYNNMLTTTELIFTTVTLEGIAAPKNLPQHTLEKPFLKQNFEISDYNPVIETMTPREAPDWSEELKMRQAWRTYMESTNPHFVHFCNRNKRGCAKSSKPHRCWRTAPLLCLPYIKKGQEDQLRYLIKLLESMIGKPFPPKMDIFDKIKYRPNVRAQLNECEDSTEGKIFGACTESTTCGCSDTESTPSFPDISLPACPTTCPPPFPLTHPPTCSPTSTSVPSDICSTTTKTRGVKAMSLLLSKQFNENAAPPITFPVIDEHYTPSFCARRFSQYFSPLGKDATSNTPSSTNTATSDGSTLSYNTENEVYFRQPNLFQGRLLRPAFDALDDSFDFSEKLLLPRWGCKGECLRLPDSELPELESLLDLPEIQKPHLRRELYKTMRSMKHFPYGTDDYLLHRTRVKPKSFDKLLIKGAFPYEDSSPIQQQVENDDFGIPQNKIYETDGEYIPNEEFDYDFDEPYSYDAGNIKNLLSFDTRKFSRRRMKGIKKRGTYRRHKRGDDYYFSPEKLESYDDYEGPNYSDKHSGSLAEGDSESQTPPTFDTFFSELAKAVSESATTPSTEEEIKKYLVTNGSNAPSVTEPFLQSLSEKKNVENTTKSLENMTFQNKRRSSTFATDFGFKVSERQKTSIESPRKTEKQKTEMKNLNESSCHINCSPTVVDYPLYATSTTELDLEFEDDEMAYPDNMTNEKGGKNGKKTSFFPSKPKTMKKAETESTPTECSRLNLRDDKGLGSNQDLDSAEDGQVPTTLKMAIIAKGAKRTTAKPSPKVYTKVYPDSMVKESDLNETMFTVKSTTSNTSEQTTPATAFNKTVDLKLQMLAVCEGYLEVIRMIRAQNQTAGNDIDLQLARYCENIISQNFNSQSEKPKKQEWNDSQSLSGTDKADDSIEDEQELSKRENLNPELIEPVTETDSEKGNENSRNINSAETTTKEIETVDQTKRPGLSKKRKRKKRRKPKQQGKAENRENFVKRGVSDEQIKMIKLLRKRKKELLSWLLNRPNKSKVGGMQENEYFDDQNALNQIPDEYSGPIKLRKNLEETKKNPLINDSEFPVYAKGFGYDKGGEVREVDIIWRKFNEKTHEKKIFKNMSVLALLLTTTSVPELNQEDLKLVGSNELEGEEISEIHPKNEDRVGVILERTETTLRNFSNNDTITTPMTTIATTTTTTTTTTTARTTTTAKTTTTTRTTTPTTRTTTATTRTTVARVSGVTTPTTAITSTAPKTNVTMIKIGNTTGTKIKTMATKKPARNNTELIITKPDSKTFIGRPPGANKTHSNATRKSHRFGTAKDIFQEYSIEFLDYAVYILPVMFTILFLFCCLCCAVHISTVWKKRKRKKKKKKKKKKQFSSEETSDSSESTDSESEKQRSKRKGLKSYMKGKNDKKFWKVLNKDETKPDEEKNAEKKKNFLRFLKGKKEGEEGPSYSSPPHLSEKRSGSSGDEKQHKWSDDQQKGKSEANSEAAERRELISLLEELKKIETEHVEEKKDVKSVHVQYMMQEDETPVFERLDLGYPYEKNVFGLPKGYSFCSKQIPFRRTNPNAVDDCELYENVNELTELLPCKCGYYSNDYCDFRINKKGRCERFVKIFRDSDLNRTQPFIDKNCTENEKGSFIFNKYRSISTDEGEDLLGVTQRNVGTEVRLMENSSPIPLRPKKNADFLEEMENLKRQLNKKKNVRLKDHGVLCRL